jgi:hypothetical protein
VSSSWWLLALALGKANDSSFGNKGGTSQCTARELAQTQHSRYGVTLVSYSGSSTGSGLDRLNCISCAITLKRSLKNFHDLTSHFPHFINGTFFLFPLITSSSSSF